MRIDENKFPNPTKFQNFTGWILNKLDYLVNRDKYKLSFPKGMYLRESKNEYGTPVSFFRCGFCGKEYDVCPSVEESMRDSWAEGGCQEDSCPSYDPKRDADILFMSDDEIAEEKPLVHISMLSARKSKTLSEKSD